MSYWLMKSGGAVMSTGRVYICDAFADLTDISPASQGDKAYVIATEKKYALNSGGTWCEVAVATGSSGGSEGSGSGVDLTTSQELTAEQKATARTNIGAAPMTVVNAIERKITPETQTVQYDMDTHEVGRLDSGGMNLGETAFWTTDYLPISSSGTQSITLHATFTGDYWYAWDFYDADKTRIANVFVSQYIGTPTDYSVASIPSTAVYFRASAPIDTTLNDPSNGFYVSITTQSVLAVKFADFEEDVFDEVDDKIAEKTNANATVIEYDMTGHTVGRLDNGSLNTGVTDFWTTDYIPISTYGDRKIVLNLTIATGAEWYSWDFFDANKTLVSGSSVSQTFAAPVDYEITTIPATAAYIRVSVPVDTDSVDPPDGYKTTVTTDGAFCRKLKEVKSTTLSEADGKLTSALQLNAVETKYDMTNHTVGRLDYGTVNVATTNFWTTDYIPVSSAGIPKIVLDVKIATGSDWYAWDFYNSSKTFITNSYSSQTFGTAVEHTIAVVPAGAAYMRVSAPIDTTLTDPSDGFSVSVTVESGLAYRFGTGRKTFDYSKYHGVPFYGVYRIPLLQLYGDVSAMTKSVEANLTYKYRNYTSKDAYTDLSGPLTCKWQGSSSINFPKKNYTLSFETGFNPKLYQTDGQQYDATGWGTQKKFCLKANYVDQSQARNILCARLWSQMVAARTGNTITQLSSAPNNGAIDGFPILLTINDEYQGLYTWNIPKEPWMFGMGSGTNECVLCADATGNVTDYRDACKFKHAAICTDDTNGETDFTVEYVTDEDNQAWVATSLNNLITAASAAESIDSLSTMLDIDSAMDMMLFIAAIGGMDNVVCNYLMCTYDGTKWFFSAYDMDGTFGNHWSGERYINPTTDYPKFANLVSEHKIYELIWTTKKAAIVTRWNALRASILTEANLATMAYNFSAAIPDAARRYENILWPMSPGSGTNDIDQMIRWFRLRLDALDAEISA